MLEKRKVKKVYKWKPMLTQPLGRPKNRRKDDTRNDMKKLKIKNWTSCIQDRNRWKLYVEKAKTFKELSCSMRRGKSGRMRRRRSRRGRRKGRRRMRSRRRRWRRRRRGEGKGDGEEEEEEKQKKKKLHKLQRRQIHCKSRTGGAKMIPSSSPWCHLILH
jgi:hypothetical protein